MRSVMIVDDYSVFRRRIAHFSLWKQQSEFSIALEAENGKRALELAAKQPVDLIITDIKMPLMDGLTLLREVKERKLCPCVVLLSEYGDFQYAREGLVLGAFDYLVKPVDEKNLLQLLDRVSDFLAHREREENFTSEITLLADSFCHLSEQLPGLSRQVLEHLYQHFGENIVSTGVAAAKIADGTYQRLCRRFGWLSLYTNFKIFSENEVTFEDWATLRFTFEQSSRDLLTLLRRLYLITDDQIVSRSIEYILAYPEADLGLNTVAERLFVNKSYLSSRFKKVSGIAFMTYVNQVKIERGKHLLSCHSLSVSEVSDRLGYHDPEYFSQLFRKSTGMKPSTYKTARFATTENSQENSKDSG